ncbi:unnamed protein product, partial [Mesorhabditis belari]|uniref:TIL domain-containing protein n=1 Tax=Mesorhabditis belari TaxID=2138241 RepID=A0AAF3J750_9BILA
MNAKILIVFSVLLTISIANEECGENEEWRNGGDCDGCSFKDWIIEQGMPCGAPAQEQCLCIKGFMRDESKKCIPADECPAPDPAAAIDPSG